MADYASARVAGRLAMPGLIQVRLHGPIAPILEDFRLIFAASAPEDCATRSCIFRLLVKTRARRVPLRLSQSTVMTSRRRAGHRPLRGWRTRRVALPP